MYSDYEDEKEIENESFYSDDDSGSSGQNSEKIKKIAIFILIFVILIVLILLLAKGCSKKTNTKDDNSSSQVVEKTTPKVMIGRSSLSLSVGEEFELQADVLNTKNNNPVIMWRSDNSSVVSVNDDGLVKAEGEGTAAIIVSYKENNKTYKNSCVVTVTEKVVKLESIKLSQKEITLKKNGTFLIEISVAPKDAKIDKFIFESSDTNILTVNEKGKITAVGVGTAVVTVKNEDGSVSETMSVNIVEDKNTITVIEPTGIEIVGFTNGLTVGKTTQAVVDITPYSATDTTVKWKSSNENIAKVDKNGVVTGVSAGTCTIIAVTSNNITASKDITVSPNVIPVEKITISGSTSITMKLGGTRFLKYTISPSNASNQIVTYKSSNPTIVYVDSNGILAAVGIGTAQIIITTQDGGKTAVANVTVVDSNVSGTSSSSSSSSSSSNNSSSSSSYSSNSSNYSTYNYTTDSSTYNYNSYEDYSTTNTCNAYDMLSIKHNETGLAVVSTISFDNTKPFTKIGQTPALELIEYNNSCVKSLLYTIYYGTSVDKVDKVIKKDVKLTNIGDIIKLENGNGYYKIDVTGQTISDGTNLTKTYYAYVNNGQTTKEYFTITTKSTNNGKTFTINKKDNNLKRVYYCVSSGANCTPIVNSNYMNKLNSNKTIYYNYILMSKDTYPKSMEKASYGKQPSISKGYKICFAPYNGAILITDATICKYI